MDKIIDINSKLPKDTTIAVLDKADNQLRAFLSTETTETRYSFTQKRDKMKLVTVQDAEQIIQDLYSSFEDTGIRTFNEDTKIWSITPMSEIEFVPASVEYEE